ncbi:MAG: hypothetical protein JWQ09_738 [Segetibacter sp.]|nr:hypothetical protein [Segetibacter sp.]
MIISLCFVRVDAGGKKEGWVRSVKIMLMGMSNYKLLKR